MNTLHVGDYIRCKPYLGREELRKEMIGEVIYINWRHRWFAVEIQGAIGKYRECFHMAASVTKRRQKTVRF